MEGLSPMESGVPKHLEPEVGHLCDHFFDMRHFSADAEALPGGQVTPAVWNVAHGLGLRPPPALSLPRLTPNSARPCCLAMQDPL